MGHLFAMPIKHACQVLRQLRRAASQDLSKEPYLIFRSRSDSPWHLGIKLTAFGQTLPH